MGSLAGSLSVAGWDARNSFECLNGGSAGAGGVAGGQLAPDREGLAEGLLRLGQAAGVVVEDSSIVQASGHLVAWIR